MKRLVSATLLIAGGLLAVSCGGGGGSYSGGGTPTNPSPPGGSTTSVTITIMGVNGKLSFSPNPASVPAGQSVIFKNNDIVSHRVVLDDGTVATGEIPAGGSSQALPLGAVNKSYHCSLHPSMVGSLNGAETPEPPPCTGYCG
jgi:plastocyanin